MKVSALLDGHADLQNYLEAYELMQVAQLREHKRQLKALYRHYHAVLVWHAHLTRSSTPHLTAAEYKTYFLFLEEAVSDLCQALFLWSHGLYKPSCLILRSSVENFFRSIGLYERQAILGITSVYELVEVIRNVPIVQSSSTTKILFEQMHGVYKTLCRHVHTSDKNHMALITAVGALPTFDKAKANTSGKHIRNQCQLSNGFLCFMFSKKLRKFHHSDRDSVLDALRPSIRREVMR